MYCICGDLFEIKLVRLVSILRDSIYYKKEERKMGENMKLRKYVGGVIGCGEGVRDWCDYDILYILVKLLKNK